MSLDWRQVDACHARAGRWRLAKFRVGDALRFVLSHDDRVQDMGFRYPVHQAWYFDDAQAARAAAEAMETARA